MLVFGGLLILVHVAGFVNDVLNLTWVVHGDLVVALVQGLVSTMLVSAMDILTVGSVVSMKTISLIIHCMFKDRLDIGFFLFNTMVKVVEFSLG